MGKLIYFIKGAIIAPFFISCALTITRPKLELEYARVAFEAARTSSADRFASLNFRKAEVLLLKAQTAYRKKSFDKAKKFAKYSLHYSEKAEFESIKRQALSNETIDEFE